MKPGYLLGTCFVPLLCPSLGHLLGPSLGPLLDQPLLGPSLGLLVPPLKLLCGLPLGCSWALPLGPAWAHPEHIQKADTLSTQIKSWRYDAN